MKILVLGTSNSIIAGGYIDGLSSRLPDAEIVNKSVGASPGSQFACYCGEEIGDYDYVIFDSVVCDENHCERIGDEQFFESVLFEIFSTIAAQARLVVVGFCNERNLETGSVQQDIHRRCAQKCGAAHVGFGDYCVRNNLKGPFYDACGTHITPEVAFKFGQYLADEIRSTPRVEKAKIPVTSNFLTLDASKMCKTSYMKRNRLGEWNFGYMEGVGAYLDISDSEMFMEEKYKILGMYIDKVNTNCALRITSSNNSGRVIPLRHEIKNERAFVVFVPFKDGVVGRKLCIDDGLGEQASGAPGTDEGRRDGAPESFRAAISKIVCWRV